MSNDFAKDYVDVAARLVLFREQYPEGSLRPFDPADPVKIVTVGDKTFLQYVACAYRNPGDAAPGIGVAWEPFPGKTPYTKDSEAMVAETSAWGRAIVAALAADTKKGVASAEEVRNRREPELPPDPRMDPRMALFSDVKAAGNKHGMSDQETADDFTAWSGTPIRDATTDQLTRYAHHLKEEA